MAALKFEVVRPGMLSTIQDLGRYGFQADGVPVAGAMDAQALKLGNILAGNEEGAAALEITLMGPTLKVIEGEGVIAVTGAMLGFKVNGTPHDNWRSYIVKEGDEISFTAPSGDGCRALLCVSGGFDIPLVMNSRSTYTRGKLGGVEGRALKTGDILRSYAADPLWRESEGLVCPESLRPNRSTSAPIRIIPGLQEAAFTEAGIKTFYESTYKITPSADRMGYRMDGASIEHTDVADIVSDAICLGSVQVPGHGQPIVMLADRQTTGGYTKLGTVCSVDIANLAQRIPGQDVKFERITRDEAISLLRAETDNVASMRRLRAAYRSKTVDEQTITASVTSGIMDVTLEGTKYNVSWEEI